MMMNDVVQGSDEWRQLRCGKITASDFRILYGPVSAIKRLADVVREERATGVPREGFGDSVETAWGKRHEPAAIAAYELRFGVDVSHIGFVKHPTHPFTGCSPDGLVDSGGVEVKCPYNQSNHLAALAGITPGEHLHQIQGAMWITGREWWDFVSFDPRLRHPQDLIVNRIRRDVAFIADLEIRVLNFEALVEDPAIHPLNNPSNSIPELF